MSQNVTPSERRQPLDDLKRAILKVVAKAHVEDNVYPDGPDIHKRLKREGIIADAKEVLAAIMALEAEGILKRAPHYFVSE